MQRIFGSQILSDSTPRGGSSDYWRALFYLNIYRMLLSVFLVTASLATITVGSLGSKNPEQFFYASAIYATLSLLFMLVIHKGWPRYVTQCRIQILVDITVIIILYHASSGRGGGLEILLFVSVSASGILLGGRGALAAASVATIFLILEHTYVIVLNQRAVGGFTTLALIGGGLFGTAFIIYYLSLLLRSREKLVEQQNRDLQKLSNINEIVVDQLTSGVIIIDRKLQLILINQSGRSLLNIGSGIFPLHLNAILPELSLIISKDNRHQPDNIKVTHKSGTILLINYTVLNQPLEGHYMIILEDYSQIEKMQRDEKFMAMGRLSASIAHEIRNPLGAISHAGQLLEESHSLNTEDTRLIEIINKQSSRVNIIVQTILDLGQTQDQNIQSIDLYQWLSTIVKTFRHENHLEQNAIVISGRKSVSSCGDVEQLQHVIINLLSNALRFTDATNFPLVTINIEQNETKNASQISISDNGPGVAADIQNNIFEPFFTTSSTGNGLGLYISRNICLSNHGSLEYYSDEHTKKHYFMITLQNRHNCQLC